MFVVLGRRLWPARWWHWCIRDTSTAVCRH